MSTARASSFPRHACWPHQSPKPAEGRRYRRWLVLAPPIGTPLAPRNVIRIFRSLVTEAKLPAIRLHDLRHTAASLLLAQGVAARTIMETLGHSQINLTMDTYSHLMPALQADAAAKMDAVLTAAPQAR